MIMIHTQVAKKGRHEGDSREDFEDGNCDFWNPATFWEIDMCSFFTFRSTNLSLGFSEWQ